MTIEDDKLIKLAARQLRQAANLLVITMAAKRAADASVAECIKEYRGTAELLDAIEPIGQGTMNWNKGMATAMQDYKPYTGGMPRVWP